MALLIATLAILLPCMSEIMLSPNAMKVVTAEVASMFCRLIPFRSARVRLNINVGATEGTTVPPVRV